MRSQATQVAARAYAPYSGLSVGAAGLLADGRIVVGCNVENASYGLALCAEAAMIAALHSGGAAPLLAVACRAVSGEPLMPCGRCRQLLFEAAGADLLVDGREGPLRLGVLLPYAFGPLDLPMSAKPVDGTPDPA